jgi:hypothetical protein
LGSQSLSCLSLSLSVSSGAHAPPHIDSICPESTLGEL